MTFEHMFYVRSKRLHIVPTTNWGMATMVCFVQIFLNAIIDQKSRYEWFKL